LNRTKFLKNISITAIISFIVGLTALTIGSADISLNDIWQIFFGSADTIKKSIILDIRLPRVLLAFVVGGGLSVTGAVFQALLINPLAEPYILGVSSGGAFGAIMAILLGFTFLSTQLFAFAGAVFIVILVFMIGKISGNFEPNILLFSGVMIGSFFSALILVSMTLLGENFRNVIFWLLGNLSLADKNSLLYISPAVIVISAILSLMANKFNILFLGTEEAKHLGVNVNKVRALSYLLSSILVGAIVSITGIIGFVGLIIPHICRMLFGMDNRIIIPVSFFIGAAYLIIMDTIARIIILPAELPVGAITALSGAPVFIYLLRKRFKLII